MEQRQHGDDDVVRLDVEQPPRDVGVHVQLDVGELGPLGLARGPRGVDDDGGVGGLPHHHRQRWRSAVEQLLERHRPGGTGRVPDREDRADPCDLGALGRLGQHAFPGDQDQRSAVLEVVGDLGGPEQDVERDHHGARLEDPEVGDQELRDVGQLQRDPLAGLDPGYGQAGRHPVRGLVELAVGQLASVEYRHRVVWCAARAFGEDDGKVEAHGPSFISC